MKNLIYLVNLLCCSFSYAQISVKATVKGYGNSIAISYWKDFTYVNDTLNLKMNQANFNLKSSEPIFFRLTTIDPASYSPFFIAFPGETIVLEKDKGRFIVKGGAELYNRFLSMAY